MFCPNCGKENNDGEEFCVYCKSRLGRETDGEILAPEDISPDGGKRSEKGKKRKKRGFLKGFVSGVAVSVIVVLAAVSILNTSASDKLLDKTTTAKINLLASYIQSYYYEDVDIETLREGLFDGLFSNLDTYSVYYTQEEYEDLYETDITGSYGGIGASLQKDSETGTVTVIRVYDGTPAQEAGLMAGDVVEAADEYQAEDMDLTEFVSHIRGEEGTSVTLTVQRDGETFELEITRAELVIPTVTYDMLENNTGYIEISEFTNATPDQFKEALDDLADQGMEALIVDLRSNPGGILDAVCEVLDYILPEGLLVYTLDRNGDKTEYNSTDEDQIDVPLAVLVDENSASASEIFAGAVQDRGAGTLIGTVTFGKGIVQSVIPLTDGSGFKLTTSSYYTPSGVCIQGIGITPDVEIEYEFLGDEDDDYSYELDNQILKAIEVLWGE